MYWLFMSITSDFFDMPLSLSLVRHGLTLHKGRQAARIFGGKGLFVGSRLDFEWGSAPSPAGLARPERANSLTRDSISFVHQSRMMIDAAPSVFVPIMPAAFSPLV